MASIEAKLNLWKNKLLDLGRRNRLVSFKDTKMSTVRIIEPSCYDLFQYFVVDENQLVFPAESDSYEKDGIYAEDHSYIKTDKSPVDLTRVLRNLRNKARTALEEQGINMLYLSFGFLKYTEADHSNYEMIAPIILVPVSLTIESITDPYVLSLHEDEIVVNPTLAYKLKSEYGITLPSFDESDSLKSYFESILQIVSVNHWDIEEGVALSLLSFLKINMYNDLQKHTDEIKANLIVRAISGDSSALTTISEDILDFSNYDFDEQQNPKNVFQIVDADSSQQEAILLAKKGASFILQGPPGTGKSQTITNIIAETLASGKTVLFVSEKQAALDVVHHRLKDAGLADFCLVLHSHKANKRNILDQLEASIALSNKKATLTDEAYQRLNTLINDRASLNLYAKQLHTAIEPLKKTIYEAYGILANLESTRNLVFNIPNIQSITQDDLANTEYAIQKYAYVIEQLKGDYRENPWKGSNLEFITNEYRHDAGAYLPVLKDSYIHASQIVKEASRIAHTDFHPTFSGVTDAVDLLSVLFNSFEIPSKWIYDTELDNYVLDITAGRELQSKYHSICSKILSISENTSYRFDVTQTKNLSQANESKSIYQRIISSDKLFSTWENKDTNHIIELINQIENVQKSIESIEKQILQSYDSDVFTIDYNSILARYKTEYTSFIKYFKASYKEDRKLILLHRIAVSGRLTDDEILDLIMKLEQRHQLYLWFENNKEQLDNSFGKDSILFNTDMSSIRNAYSQYCNTVMIIALHDELIQLHKEEQIYKNSIEPRFATMYQGLDTDWNDIENALNWALQLKGLVEKHHPSDAFVKTVCHSTQDARIIGQQRENLLTILETVNTPSYLWFTGSFETATDIYNTTFDDMAERIGRCSVTLEQLEEWIDYRNARKECERIGLSDFVDIIAKEGILPSEMVSVYRKRFFTLWLDVALINKNAVRDFRRRDQEHRIEEFCSLDRLQFEIARLRIKSQLINSLPSFTHFTKGIDEVSVLKRELAKQRKIMPIRKLFREIPNLLLTLKPCLMMSPLSVSLFLEADKYKFDLVVFDESSQVFTENAIGAIFRGKQVIIAGDSKQLPPTNFFQTTVAEGDYDVDDDEEEDLDVFESILDEANMLPERTLLWHYRSRHESLIAFSNAKIYKNSLITFPSNIESAPGNGVEYVYVPSGFYDRGGRRGNVIEAKKVAELVFEHFRKTPERSLGVIAFGENQQNAIDTELRALRMKNKTMEPYFTDEKEEPFFIKSLENVQGDERDTIIFSIGYAKDINGVFRNQFGPLGKAGGERRLNVAITRAKYNVKLVGSILPTDIDVDKINSEGPKLLRAYIDYAMNGTKTLASAIEVSDTVEHDSPFEEAVYNYLDRRGYKLATQVGCSGYRIDMAIEHPYLSGIYVLGIECDGASYHSAKTARERDRLRQDVLESMGWKLYRIWSTDWIKDPVSEGRRLQQAAENAIRLYDENNGNGQHQSSNGKTGFVIDKKDYIQIEDAPEQTLDPVSLYGFSKAPQYSFQGLPKDSAGYLDIHNCIRRVVENEYPIHFDLLCQRLAPLYGNEKATSRVRREIELGIYGTTDVVKKGSFVYPKSYDRIVIRMPNERQIQYISKEELATAMLMILKKCIGTTKQALIAETARAYGFMRTGYKIQDAMEQAFDLLVKRNAIIEQDGKIDVLNMKQTTLL